MSITVRLWTARELEAVMKMCDLTKPRTARQYELATLLLNTKTFSTEGVKVFHELVARGIAKVYHAEFFGSDDDPVVTFRAPSDEYAKWFLAQEYTVPPDRLAEVVIVTEYREVEL